MMNKYIISIFGENIKKIVLQKNTQSEICKYVCICRCLLQQHGFNMNPQQHDCKICQVHCYMMNKILTLFPFFSFAVYYFRHGE